MKNLKIVKESFDQPQRKRGELELIRLHLDKANLAAVRFILSAQPDSGKGETTKGAKRFALSQVAEQMNCHADTLAYRLTMLEPRLKEWLL